MKKPTAKNLMQNKSSYFRISLTQVCNLNCYFCHNEGQSKQPTGNKPLSADEIIWLSSIAQKLGYTKFKLTGGEPLLHPEILKIVRGINDLGVDDLSIITNAIRLPQLAQPLFDAGLHRLNISLYSLNSEKFAKNNGGTPRKLERVINGIDTALAVGFKDIKLNYVWDGEENLSDFKAVLDFAGARGLTVVLLPLMRYNEAGESAEISLDELYQQLVVLGIDSERIITDNEGIRKKLITLSNSSKVLIRIEELKDKYPYNHCKTCTSKAECKVYEGIFPTRLSADAMLYPCLADTSLGVSLRTPLLHRNEELISQSFEKVRNL